MAKRDEEYLSKDEIIAMIVRSKLPVLTLDRKWLGVFSNDEKSSKIKTLEEKVNKSLKSQGSINTKRDDLIRLKKTLMREIMTNMDAKENSRERKKVTKSKELIEDINEQLILLEDKELDVPGNIDYANAQLAFQSIEEVHDKLEENDEQIESLNEWIEATREEIKKRIALREAKLEQNARMEKFLENTFRPDIIREYRRYRELD